MDNEPYRDLSHLELIATVSDWLRSQGFRVVNEFKLPSGKIADVFATHWHGGFHIVECKTFATSSMIARVFDKYYQWCNALWIAAPLIPRFIASDEALSFSEVDGARKVGMIQVNRDCVRLHKQPCAHTLDPVTVARLRSKLPTT